MSLGRVKIGLCVSAGPSPVLLDPDENACINGDLQEAARQRANRQSLQSTDIYGCLNLSLCTPSR